MLCRERNAVRGADGICPGEIDGVADALCGKATHGGREMQRRRMQRRLTGASRQSKRKCRHDGRGEGMAETVTHIHEPST